MMGVSGIWRRRAPFWDWGSTTAWAALRCTTEKFLGCRRGVKCQHPAHHLRPAVLVRENFHPRPDLLGESLDPVQAMEALEVEVALADCIRWDGRKVRFFVAPFVYSTVNDCFSGGSALRPVTMGICR